MRCMHKLSFELQLAVDIASRFNGEVINADAVQMYKGLPIVTNKIPDAERNGIPHHLLDEIGLREEPWTVHQFVEESSKIIEAIRARGRLPVVVGGTSYYIYSLLFHDAIITADSDRDDYSAGGHGKVASIDMSDKTGPRYTYDLLEATTEDLYRKLAEIDPEMASRWHPKDRRKIQRSLEIWFKTGKKPSQVYAEQATSRALIETEDEQSGVKYRPLIFWLDADDSTLKTRLNDRVDKMVEEGLLDEVKTMRVIENDCKAEGVELDQSKGIWVAIGYKQLSPWLDIISVTGNDQSLEDQKTTAALRAAGIEAVKSATRQYAKRQDRWIRLRFAKGLQSADLLDDLFLLDGTDLHEWAEKVEKPAFHAVELFSQGQTLPAPASISDRAASKLSELHTQELVQRRARFCDICQKTLMSEPEWLAHLKSQSHKKVQAGIRKRAMRDEYLASMKNG